MRHRLRRSHHHSGNRPKHHKETTVKFSQHHLWYLGLGIGLTVLTWLLKPVIALLAASAAIAYILDPLIDRFEENGWSRDQGIAIIVGIGSLVILVGIIAFIPPVIAQIDKLSDDMRIVLGNLDQTLQNLTIWIEQKTGQEIDLGLAEIQETLPIWIEQFSQEWQAKLLDIVKGLFLRGMGLINTLLNLLLLPVFTYYLLRDWDILLADAFELIPHKFRPVATRTFGEVNTRLNAFIIGQIKVCLALAVLYTVGLLIIGIDLAVPIGVVSGILFVIPYVGTVFGIFAASILALINFGVDWHVLGVFAVFGIAQTIEGYYLTPKIVGESVGLSPMVVMIALIVGASFMGIWGMLIAIPVTAVLSVLATEWLTNYRESDTFYSTKANMSDAHETMFQVEWHWQVPYIETLHRQERLRQNVYANHPEVIVLAEHLPTITLGKRGGTVLTPDPNTEVHRINRGGLATWHGPGQLAIYPIIDLRRHHLGVRTFACLLESATIETLGQFKIMANRNPGQPGIWVQNRKIAALGLDIKKDINIHGIALNISNAPSCFAQIEACGDSSVQYTSVCQELDQKGIPLQYIGKMWVENFRSELNAHKRNNSSI